MRLGNKTSFTAKFSTNANVFRINDGSCYVLRELHKFALAIAPLAARGWDSHMKGAGMLVGNFELNP